MRISGFFDFLVPISFLPLLSAQDVQSRLLPAYDSALPTDASTPLKVAIIGAGAAGSSAAYHLSLFANASTSARPLEVTIFDPQSHAGGRSTTVDALDDSTEPVELGASIFVKINHIVYNASLEFGLSTTEGIKRKASSGFQLGVWDGNQFVFKQASDGDSSDGGRRWGDWTGWWDIAKLLWRYGLSPIRTQRLMKDSVGRFLRFYDEPIFPFARLDNAIYTVELEDFIGTTGEAVLQKAGVSVGFQREIIQASTRVNYGQNLAEIHGLEAMVCMATDGAMQVQGGNWQIFQKMVEASGADFQANTTVTHIERAEDGTYLIKSTMKNPKTGTTDTTAQTFDTVILSTPLQFSNLTISPSFTNTPSPIPYVHLHVTLLTSPHRLAPSFFGLESQNLVPDMILTTLPENYIVPPNARGATAVGPAGFWSVSLLREIDRPKQRTQYLYKVFSPSRLTGTWVSQLLDFEYANTTISDPLSNLPKSDVTWLHEKVWDSYPYEVPRTSFEEIRLDGLERGCGNGVWYTSGIESFISTMETSALMGKNVARLMLDELELGGQHCSR